MVIDAGQDAAEGDAVLVGELVVLLDGLDVVEGSQERAAGHARTRPRPIDEWIEIAVPAIVDDDTFAAAARRLEDNRRFSARNTKEPSLLMGLVSCQSCGYAYYRTSTRTEKRKPTTTAVSDRTTTATSTDASARTSRCEPTTSTNSCGHR
ncbi:MAG: hypothetical protein ACRD0A_11020 [Acidimicrobiales bacterium]